MSFREEAGGGGGGDGRDLQKPFLHTGSWYKMNSRQSSVMGSTTQIMRDGSVSVLFCVLIAALGPIQFGFTVCFNSIQSIHSQFCLIHRQNNQLLIFNFLFFYVRKVWIFFSDATSYNQGSKPHGFRGVFLFYFMVYDLILYSLCSSQCFTYFCC
jgi:hypothetical protein